MMNLDWSDNEYHKNTTGNNTHATAGTQSIGQRALTKKLPG